MAGIEHLVRQLIATATAKVVAALNDANTPNVTIPHGDRVLYVSVLRHQHKVQVILTDVDDQGEDQVRVTTERQLPWDVTTTPKDTEVLIEAGLFGLSRLVDL